MSNDSCVAVVKTHNEYFTDVIAGVSNLKIKSETDADTFLTRMNETNGVFYTLNGAIERANFLAIQFTREMGQPPVYGIIQFDWSRYA